MSDQCYFMGKLFDSLEEAIQYEAKWQVEPLDQESAEMLVKSLGKDIVMNTMLACEPMTNLEFKNRLNQIFDYSVKVMRNE